MVFTQGRDVDVTDQDHLVVVLCEDGIVDDICGRGVCGEADGVRWKRTR